MIKLTRGALTMLLAQYRGILKNAWIKNFAVAAALATTVTTAYADPAKVTTWEQATSKDVVLDGKSHGEDAAAYTGTLNLQSGVVIKGAQQITITGGADHKIGASEQDKSILIDAEDEGSYANLTINGVKSDNAATLTIDSNKTSGDAKTTGIWLNEVKVGVEGEGTATLNVNNSPAWIANSTNFVEDKGDYTDIDSLEIGKQGTVAVAEKAELDVSDKLTIAEGGNLNNKSHLWLGRDKETGIATEINVDGTLSSEGQIYLDSNKLTVGKNGSVNVKGILGLNNVDSVNINDLTNGDKAKITLNGDTHVSANTLVLDAKINDVKSVTAADLTLGSDKYDNSGLAVNATVTTKLTAKAVAGSEKDPQAYKINNDESINLNAVAVHPGISIGNETGVGTVASDLEVAGGNLNVQAGTWNAEGLTLTDGTATVEGNAALALKALNIAAGKKLTVEAKDAQDKTAGVLDLTNAKLVNDTSDAAQVKGTIDNSGIVKIGGDTLAKAIANGEKDKGYIFDNKAGAQIQVAGPATLATGVFLADTSKSGIKNAGTLAVYGALTVNGPKDAVSTLENAGTIKAASLQLNGKEGGAKDAAGDSKFTLAAGTYEITGAVGANTDTLAIDTGANVKAQSIGARILEITGNVGADKANVGSISATDSLTTLAGSKVFADSITAGSIDFSGAVTAGKVTSTKGLTVTAGTHVLGDVTDSSEDGITLTAGKVTVTGALNAAKLAQDAGNLIVEKGSLTVTEATVKGTTLDGATANIGTLAVASDTENALVLEKSTATVGSFDGDGAKAGSISVREGSTLTISATQHTATEKDKAIFKNNATGDAIKGDGTLAVNAGALGLKQNDAKNNYVATNKFAKDTIGVLKINGADSAIGADKINKDNLGKLITALSVNSGDEFDGKLQLVGVTADIGDAQETTDAKNGSYKQDDVAVFAKLAGDTTLQSVTVDAGNGATAVSGDLGNLVADKGTNSVSIGDATLQGSGSSGETNGYYVSALKDATGDDAKKVVLAGAELENANSSLTLAGAGKIGAVTAASSGVGTLNVTGSADVVKVVTEGDKEVVKAENIGTDSEKLAKVNVSGALTAANICTKALESSGSVVAANISAETAEVTGGVVNADKLATTGIANIKAGSVNVGDAEFTGALKMEGGALTATAVKDGPTGKVDLKKGAKIDAGTIVAKTIEVSGAKLESAGNIVAETLKTTSVDADLTGGVVKADTVTLGGATKIIGNASLIAGDLTATGKTITVGEDGDEGSAGFLFAKNIIGAGKIVIDPEFSQGVALGGTTAFAGSNELTTNIVVGQNSIFAYDENLTAEQLKSLASKYTLSDAENGVGSLLVVNSAIDLNGHGINVGKDASTTTTNDKLVLSKNGALAVGGTALANANLANATPKAAVTATSGVEYDKTSKVLLDGGVKAGAQYQIFSGAVAANATSADADLTASSLNGFYTATIGVDGKTTKVAANRSVLSQLTTPLYEHLLAVTGNGNKGAGVQFLEKVASESLDGGKDAETVARLGAFGGLYNAAYNVNKTSADAIAARTAMGNNGVQQVATNNAIGGAVWLSPVYKNVKADTFESDGKESGADVKLTGVALGADVTTANNVRLGAMFNLGSGDTDGNKLGSRAENDFDYFGFGVYAAYNYGNFGVAADATYAKVDNDLSASSSLGYGYFKSSVDTNVYSLGLTAKYAFDTNFATITPHAGIRYTSLNADSYDVESAYGTLATTSYDSASVVSFPVGVTFTKDIKVNAWKVQPTFDVTLTANAGDTEAEYDTYFTGADSKVKLESEFVDSFTYGLTAGFEAQHESGVALGLGVNYEGSSNTNSYGVTGNVRYTF